MTTSKACMIDALLIVVTAHLVKLALQRASHNSLYITMPSTRFAWPMPFTITENVWTDVLRDLDGLTVDRSAYNGGVHESARAEVRGLQSPAVAEKHLWSRQPAQLSSSGNAAFLDLETDPDEGSDGSHGDGLVGKSATACVAADGVACRRACGYAIQAQLSEHRPFLIGCLEVAVAWSVGPAQAAQWRGKDGRSLFSLFCSFGSGGDRRVRKTQRSIGTWLGFGLMLVAAVITARGWFQKHARSENGHF